MTVTRPEHTLNIRVYLNPNTGRFWTMDTDEGNNEDPLSLHKYCYGADNPVNQLDPSGNDYATRLVFGELVGLFAFGEVALGSSSESGLTPLPPLPTTVDGQLLLGLVYAESSTPGKGGGEDEGEKIEIALTVLNRVYYAQQSIRHKNNYDKEFGNGTMLGAIGYAPPKQFVGYLTTPWNQIMNGDRLKPQSELESLRGADRQHLVLSISSAAYADNGNPLPPTGLADSYYFPIAFNTSGHVPGPARMFMFAKLGGTTFYAFKQGREYQ